MDEISSTLINEDTPTLSFENEISANLNFSEVPCESDEENSSIDNISLPSNAINDDNTPTLSFSASFEEAIKGNVDLGMHNLPVPVELAANSKVPVLNILDRIKMMNQIRAQREQTITYLRNFKDLESNLRSEIGRLKSLIEDRNYVFHNLELSDAKLQELRLKRADELSTYDLACVRATEAILVIKEELELARKKIAEMQHDRSALLASENQLRLELERERKLAAIAAESSNLEYKSLDQRCQRLSALLESETSARRIAEDKAQHYDVLVDENKKLMSEVITMRKVLDQQSETVSALSKSEQSARQNLADSERARDLLTMDKAYLNNELQTAEARATERGRQADENASKARNLEIKLAQMTEQLLALQLKARTEFDERIEKDIHKLKEDSQREIDSIRLASRELADRENRVLRETIENNEGEISHLRRRCDALSNEVQALTKENMTTLCERNQEISQLHGELKMKAFQLSSLGITFEERSSCLRSTEMELSICKEEIQAHKTALLAQRAEADHRQQHLTHELDNALRKLRIYEDLEQEIDNAVLRAAKNTSSDGALSADTNNASEHALLQSIRNAPSNPERRAKQAVYLAHKLLETERERDELIRKLKVLEDDATRSAAEIEDLKKSLEMCNQPAAYVVLRLRSAEKIVAQITAANNSLKAELDGCKGKLRVATEAVEDLKQRLTVLLQQRSEVSKLTELLELWREQQEQQEEEDEAEEGFASEQNNRENAVDLNRIEAIIQQTSGLKASSTPQRKVSQADSQRQHVSSTVKPSPRNDRSIGMLEQAPQTVPMSELPKTASSTTPVSSSKRQPAQHSSPPNSSESQSTPSKGRAALSSLSPEQISRMITRPSQQLVAGTIDSDSYNSGKSWFQRTTLDD